MKWPWASREDLEDVREGVRDLDKKFDKFLHNDFMHCQKDIWHIKGTLVILMPLILTILAIVSALAWKLI